MARDVPMTLSLCSATVNSPPIVGEVSWPTRSTASVKIPGKAATEQGELGDKNLWQKPRGGRELLTLAQAWSWSYPLIGQRSKTSQKAQPLVRLDHDIYREGGHESRRGND